MSTRPSSMEPITFDPYTIYRGDCLEILKHFPSESVDLIYIDPPFNSNRNYEVFWGDTAEKRAFEDRYGDAQAYIAYMRPRVGELCRVLKRTGSFYYHCDWHASHYIKVMLDEIFGANYFVNEIVWKRADAHSDARQGAKHFGRIVDSIFLYTKSSNYTFNTMYNPLPESTAEKWYRHIEPETGRRYNMADLTAAKPGGDTKYEFKGAVPPPGRYWAYSKEKMEQFDKEGRIVWSKSGKPYYKRYLDESKGVPLQSWWDDISQLRGISPSKERLGYPTQKPVALLERIVKASSNPGDIVLDAFCGCGTTLVACEQLDRQWLGIDISPTSCRVMGDRIEALGRKEMPITGVGASGGSPDARPSAGVPPDAPTFQPRYFRYCNLPMTIPQLREIPPFEFENWAVLAVGQFFNMYAQPNRSKVGDLGIDGKLYLPQNVEKHAGKDSEKTPLFRGVEGEKYVPIQVKQKDKVGRPDIDLFARAMERDKRGTGVFVAFGYSKDALSEIHRMARADTNARRIYPLTVEKLINSEFSAELDAWMGAGG